MAWDKRISQETVHAQMGSIWEEFIYCRKVAVLSVMIHAIADNKDILYFLPEMGYLDMIYPAGWF